MKRRAAAVLTAAVLLSFGCGHQATAAQPNEVVFTGVHASYAAGDLIAFRVSSNAARQQQFSCGVEKLLDGTWQLMFASIFTHSADFVRLVTLQPHASMDLEWELTRQKGSIAPGSYRFKLDIHRDGQVEPAAIFYSTAFDIRSPIAKR
jgi:hypothetical protein